MFSFGLVIRAALLLRRSRVHPGIVCKSRGGLTGMVGVLCRHDGPRPRDLRIKRQYLQGLVLGDGGAAVYARQRRARPRVT